MDNKSRDLFLNQLISGFNEIVSVAIAKKIKKIGAGLYKDVNQTIIGRSSVLKDKTLLIVKSTEQNVIPKAIEEANIKYKIVSEKEYVNLMSEDATAYCLLYFSLGEYSDIAIYDLEEDHLIYFRQHSPSKTKLMASDLKLMMKHW